MEIKPPVDGLRDEEVVVKKMDETSDMDTEDVVELSPSSLLPIYPNLSTESGKKPLDFTSPLTKPLNIACVIPQGGDYCLNSSTGDSPYTPVDASFDPFAAGSEKLLLAPARVRRNCLQKSMSSGAQYLTFGSSVKLEGTEQVESDSEMGPYEERLLEAVYDDLMEAIISGRAADVAMLDDGFETPTSQPLTNGILETCPDAPMKEARQLKNIKKGLSKKKLDYNLGLCRKLEF